VPVSSSNIASIGYDDDQMILEVEFLSGSLYRYECVSENIFNEFLASNSKGSFFHNYIRDQYPYYKIS